MHSTRVLRQAQSEDPHLTCETNYSCPLTRSLVATHDLTTYIVLMCASNDPGTNWLRFTVENPKVELRPPCLMEFFYISNVIFQ